jgi:hypothetical protein
MSELTKQISVIVWFKFNSNAEVLWLWVITIKIIQKHVRKSGSCQFTLKGAETCVEVIWVAIWCLVISVHHTMQTQWVVMCIFHEGTCVANFISCGESVCIVWRRRWKQQDGIQHSGSFILFVCDYVLSIAMCVVVVHMNIQQTFWVVTWQAVDVWLNDIYFDNQSSCECLHDVCFMCVSLFCGVWAMIYW